MGRPEKVTPRCMVSPCALRITRADCADCLFAATAGNNTSNGLPNRCPGSTRVGAFFDKCLVRYSNNNFLGTGGTGEYMSYRSSTPSSSAMVYSSKVRDRLQLLASEAAASRQRFAASSMANDPPYVLMQCTWDLPSDKCKQCLDVLLANVSDWFSRTVQGKRKSYSCTVRYSNTSFMVLPFSNGTPSGPMSPPTISSVPASTSRRGSRTVVMVVISVIASIVVAVLLGALLWRVYRSRCLPTKTQAMEDVEPTDQICQTLTTVKTQEFVPRSFTYEELAAATSDFAEGKKLGEGSFGVVYEGTVPGIGGAVAIKKIKDRSNQARNEDQAARERDQAKRGLKNEISIMIQLQHQNILRLLGWCEEGDHLLVIYEIMKNGNLEDQLYPQIYGATDEAIHGVTYTDTPLQIDWPTRHNILIGIASGLAYLHTGCPKSILHRDIKPANVLLDMDFNAKLSDFGLVTQINHTQTSRQTNNVIGTRSYIDPEFVNTGKTCAQSDVYSLGVMLLEVVCGEKPMIMYDGKNSLIEKVQRCQERNAILEVADRRLKGRRFDDEITRVLELGLMCVRADRHLRPHIKRLRDSLTQLTAGPLPSSSPNGRGADEEAGVASLLTRRPSRSRTDEEAGVASLLVRRPTL